MTQVRRFLDALMLAFLMSSDFEPEHEMDHQPIFENGGFNMHWVLVRDLALLSGRSVMSDQAVRSVALAP